MPKKHNYAFSFVYFVCYLIVPSISYDNAHHPTLAVVNDFLHGVLEFDLTFFSNNSDLTADAVLYQLLDGFDEDIGLPDAFSGP